MLLVMVGDNDSKRNRANERWNGLEYDNAKKKKKSVLDNCSQF